MEDSEHEKRRDCAVSLALQGNIFVQVQVSSSMS